MLRPRSCTWTLAALALALAPACGDDKTTESDSSDETTGSTGSDSDPGPTTGTTAEPPAPFEPVPALGGLEIDWVEANQGIGVAIGRDGAGVGGSDRTSYLLQNRLTLIRAFWKELPADWVPRKIEGRLIVSYPDGTEKVIKSTPVVEGASFIGNLSKSFYWGLMPAEVVPGIKYRIELWETESGFGMLPEGTVEGPVPPRLPHDGNAFIGIEDSYQTLKVTVVPFNYDDGQGCKTSPDTSPETMQLFQDYMFMMNPIEKLDFTIATPLDWNGPLEDFNELNQFMSGKRTEWGIPENMYLYGLIDTCSGGVNGAGGKAFGIPSGTPLKSDAWQRVSSGLSLKNNVQWSAETFVHEVGHSQGRYHIACSGEAGTDNTYPNPNGEIGEWGFGVVDFKLYHPTVHKDYMTYCHPVWASTFGWNKVYPTIKALSSWDMAGSPAPDEGELGSLLVGSIYPDGKESWMTVRGGLRPEQRSAVHTVEFFAGGEKLTSEAAAFLPQPDGDIVNVVVPLPDEFDRATQIVRIDDLDNRTVTSAKAIWQTHRALPIAAAE